MHLMCNVLAYPATRAYVYTMVTLDKIPWRLVYYGLDQA